ncbi:MAG: acylphosphatase [Candidatus Paceibacterota bacterium]|jgi:acylphosphatase
MRKRIECKITGRVQGVFYRDFANLNARELGLTGTVCNMGDGSVAVVAEGEKEDLQKFLVRLQKGTPRSKVEKIETKWFPASGDFANFQVLPQVF